MRHVSLQHRADDHAPYIAPLGRRQPPQDVEIRARGQQAVQAGRMPAHVFGTRGSALCSQGAPTPLAVGVCRASGEAPEPVLLSEVYLPNDILNQQ